MVTKSGECPEPGSQIEGQKNAIYGDDPTAQVIGGIVEQGTQPSFHRRDRYPWAQHIPGQYQHAVRSCDGSCHTLNQTPPAIFAFFGQEKILGPKPRRFRGFSEEGLWTTSAPRSKW